MEKVIVILGPTAVGKTKMSVELSKKLNGEIINADSTQIYRGLDIATAKITEEEKEGIEHHLFDIRNYTEDYTVYDYQKDCRRLIADIIQSGKTPILCGGTGLYIKAALFDYEFEDNIQRSNYEDLTNEDIYDKLLAIDPNLKIHVNNRQRLMRMFDCYNATGSLPKNDKGNDLLYDCKFIGLTTERDYLYKRIGDRVDVMMENGLLAEAKQIFDSNVRTKAVLTPIGYKEFFPYFNGNMNLNDCLDLIRQNSRRYAKRQYTWFNNQMNVKWFNVNFADFSKTVNEVLQEIGE